MIVVCPTCEGPFEVEDGAIAPLVQVACPHCEFRMILDFEAANDPSLVEDGMGRALGYRTAEAYRAAVGAGVVAASEPAARPKPRLVAEPPPPEPPSAPAEAPAPSAEPSVPPAEKPPAAAEPPARRPPAARAPAKAPPAAPAPAEPAPAAGEAPAATEPAPPAVHAPEPTKPPTAPAQPPAAAAGSEAAAIPEAAAAVGSEPIDVPLPGAPESPGKAPELTSPAPEPEPRELGWGAFLLVLLLFVCAGLVAASYVIHGTVDPRPLLEGLYHQYLAGIVG